MENKEGVLLVSKNIIFLYLIIGLLTFIWAFMIKRNHNKPLKEINQIAIWLVSASIIMGYYNNELTEAALIFRIYVIVVNIICCAVLDKR